MVLIRGFSALVLFFFHCSVVHCWYKDPDYRLPRRDPVRVGYEREVELELKKTHTIRTLSVNPPVFEVKGFLSPEECNYLMFLAKRSGMEDSPLHGELPDFHSTREVFDSWDTNQNSFIEPIEFTYIKGKGNLFIDEFEGIKMMNILKIDQNGDDRMDFQEFMRVKAETIAEYFHHLSLENPHLRSRFSDQAWLWNTGSTDQAMEWLHERMAKLTELPHEIIEASEPMQVVRYKTGGHYQCHHDSDEVDADIPCCTHETQIVGHCRQCRYLTLMFFLNNVTRGGETAFPVADNKTFTARDWEEESPTKCDLDDYCAESNLVIQPLEGTALLWYNHKVDPITGWVGELDPMTYHGGCGVTQFQKWVANTWLNVIGEKGSEESKKSWMNGYSYHDEL